MAYNVMATGERFLDAALKRFASEKVEYRPCGVGQWKLVDAVVGGTMFRGNDVNGVSTLQRSVDFIILAADLGFEPRPGDTIAMDGQLFEVYSPNDEPCWRNSGGTFDSYRIHAQAIGQDGYRPLEGTK